MESRGDSEELRSELDISMKEDLTVGLMHLVSLEEHLYFSLQETQEEELTKILTEIREMRISLMEDVVGDRKGQTWCISKHLLSGCMRLIETGAKALQKDREKAKRYFDRAFELYSTFCAVNFGEEPEMEDSKELVNGLGVKDREKKIEEKEGDLLEKFKERARDLLDCCIEK